MTLITDEELAKIPHSVIRQELDTGLLEDDNPREEDWIGYEERDDIFLKTSFGDYRIDELLSEKPNGVIQDRRYDQKDHRDGCCSCTISGTYIAINNLVGFKAGGENIKRMIEYGINNGKPEERGRSTSQGTKTIVDYYNKNNPSNPIVYFHSFLVEGDKLSPVVKYALEKKYLVRFSLNTYSQYFVDRMDGLLSGKEFGKKQGGHSTNLAFINGEYWVVGSAYNEIYKVEGGESHIVELIKNGVWRNGAYIIAPVKKIPQDSEKKESIKYMIDSKLTTQSEEQFLGDRDKPLTRGQLARILYRQSNLK